MRAELGKNESVGHTELVYLMVQKISYLKDIKKNWNLLLILEMQ